jgi:flagellar basal-body rod modification protein FlgD
MAIDAYGNYATTYTDYSTTTSTTSEDNTVLDKDDFLKLLLIELQYQDPTEPMDSEKILTQTSQLAALEASENTNDALEALAASLGNTMQFSTIAAIGKTADTGSNAILLDEGATEAPFELYFPSDVQSGTIYVMDVDGNTVDTIAVGSNDKGVYSFEWDGLTSSGESADAGLYYVEAEYQDPDGNTLSTRVGAYPIESVRFEDGEAYVKLGSSYVAFDNLLEIY